MDFRLCSKVHPPSHSCEGRNLRAERRKLSPKAYKRTITRRFAAAEIPAFAGMGRVGKVGLWERRELRIRLRRRRFRLSPEWRVLFVFADNTEFGGIRKH
ncbi:MAG: hypothetical protein ACR2QC_01955 [Gammaproteobacteria bacterium]